MKQEQLLTLEPLSEFDDNFRNDYGAIRNRYVRSHYYGNDIDLEDVVNLFIEWRNDPEYFILRGLTLDDGYQERIIAKPDEMKYGFDQYALPESQLYLYKFVKAAKRGNDVYQYLVKKKLGPLNDLEKVTFFKENWGNKKTNLLFVTLTYDNNRCDINTAWKKIGPEFHLFCNNLRKQYGHIEIFRTWESTSHYYPHVHVLIAFKDKSFPVFIHKGQDGKRSFRIPTKDKDKISSYWHSHVDIKGVDNSKGAINELTKYVTKDLCSEKGNQTNAMIWLFRKQGYSISKGFIGLITGQFSNIVDLREPKMADLIKDEMYNCNRLDVKWEFIGILRGQQLGFLGNIWTVDMKKPPPRVADLLIAEYKRWNALHGGRY